MRTLLAATAVALLLVPVGAYAQRSEQTTETQQDLRQGIKAEPATPKRDNILRSETNKDNPAPPAAPK
jgi:hypothetical protein